MGLPPRSPRRADTKVSTRPLSMPADVLRSGAMNQRLRPGTPGPAAGSTAEQTPGAGVPRRLGLRLLGWTLLTASLGLVSCQSLFVL